MSSRYILLVMAILSLVCGDHSFAQTGGGLTMVYVASWTSNQVTAIRIEDDGSVQQVAGSPYPTGSMPSAIALHPNGRFLYVACWDSAEIRIYSIDGGSGALIPIPGSSRFFTGGMPACLAFHPNGRFLCVGDAQRNQIRVLAVDVRGVLREAKGSPFKSTGAAPVSMCMSSVGTQLFVANGDSSNVSVYAFDQETGQLGYVPGSPFPAGWSPSSAAMKRDGALLFVSHWMDNNIRVYSVSSNGALEPVLQPFPTRGFTPACILIHPGKDFLYTVNSADNSISRFAIGDGGTLTEAGRPVPAGIRPDSGSIDPSGRVLVTANNFSEDVYAFSINQATGGLTLRRKLEVNGNPHCILACQIAP